MNKQVDIPVIAVDGPSGSGKGMVTHALAKATGFHILDSGALYRLIGLAALKTETDPADEPALAELGLAMDVRFEPTDDAEEPLLVYLDGEEVTRRIRTDEAGVYASRISPLPRVRESIRVLQHSFRKAPGLVADGRDMGTVICPAAQVKLYVTARLEVRAERRYRELISNGVEVTLAQVLCDVNERDARDQDRAEAPLRAATDAIEIDTSDLSIDVAIERAIATVLQNQKLNRCF